MATAFPFTPTPTSPFQFQPTLNGALYTGFVTWNLFGQRFFLNLYQSTGGLWVLTTAVVGSTPDAPINLVKGYLPDPALLFYDSINTQFVTVP